MTSLHTAREHSCAVYVHRAQHLFLEIVMFHAFISNSKPGPGCMKALKLRNPLVMLMVPLVFTLGLHEKPKGQLKEL